MHNKSAIIPHAEGGSAGESAIHATFVRRCIRIALLRGKDLELGNHAAIQQLPETGHSPTTIVGKRFITRMPHLPFANRWLYTAYNEQGVNLLQASRFHREGATVGEVRVEHLSMNQPTGTRVSYTFGDTKRVYASAAIDEQEAPPPAALSFMGKIGVPITELGWDDRPPFHANTWDSPRSLGDMHVLAILRVVNSQM